MPTAEQLLQTAQNLLAQRGETYDSEGGERSMEQTVAVFNLITGQSLRESDGWLLMLCLKLVRNQTKAEPHRDSLEDAIAYAALFAESELTE